MSWDRKKPLVVIGAGPGGVAAALRGVQLGARVILIEADKVGGVCTSRGCIPLRVLGSALEAGQADVPAPEELGSRIGQTADYIRMGTEAILGSKGVELIRGRASLAGLDLVRIKTDSGEETLRAGAVILAAGAKWLRPRLPGADLEGVISGEELLLNPGDPGRVLVLGDEPWALELARNITRLGGEAALAAPGKLLSRADRQIVGRLKKALTEQGLKVFQQAAPLSVAKTGSGLEVALEVKGKPRTVPVDRVVLTERVPSWEGLGLRTAGVEVAGGMVRTDEHLRTSNPVVFAIGDLTGPPLLSSKASAQGVLAAENALGRSNPFEPWALPTVLFTEPEVAWVGLSEKRAREKGLEVVTGEIPYGVNARAAAEMNQAGFVKIVCGAVHKEVLGVHLLGPHSAELITQACLALQLEATAEELSRVMAPHPAYAEALSDAARMALDGALYVP